MRRQSHADGSIATFNGKVFDKMVLKGKRGPGEHIRVHVKSFTLPDVQVGSILDFRYFLRYDDHTSYAPEWIVQTELFQKNVSFKFVPYAGNLMMAHERVGRGSACTSFLPPSNRPARSISETGVHASAGVHPKVELRLAPIGDVRVPPILVYTFDCSRAVPEQKPS